MVKKPIIFETDYNEAIASHLDKQIESTYKNNECAKELLIEYPTVYVINNPQKKNKKEFTVYVGETNDIQRRTLQHIDSDPKEREDFKNLKDADNVMMYVIGHEHFNKSMTLDIENKLMQYLSSVPSVKKLNNRRYNEQNKYYNSKEFNTIFEFVWKGLNKKNKYLFPAQELLESSALFKASPFNKLTKEQLDAKAKIIKRINEVLVAKKDKEQENGELILVEGDAGSGKTVLMSNIFYDLVHEDQVTAEEEKKKPKLTVSLLVNQDEQLKVYKEIKGKLFNKDDKVEVAKPVSFIKNTVPEHKVDIVLVDEAHLLQTQNSQSYANDKKHPNVKVGNNMLKDILKRAKVAMAVFDFKQFLRTTDIWDEGSFKELEQKVKQDNNLIILKNQMRIDASQETINWIRSIVDKGKIEPIPHDDRYEIKVFSSPYEMQKAIDKKNKNQEQGISRMVSTFDWKYSSKSTPKDSKYWQVKEGEWSMPWNEEINRRDKYENTHRKGRTVKYGDQSWAEKDYTIREIGSTYTVQGFDLNYVGVEIGPSVKFRNGKIIHDPSKSFNKKATQKRNSSKSFADYLLNNELNVLLTRGVHGLYIHAVDPALQKELGKAQKSK